MHSYVKNRSVRGGIYMNNRVFAKQLFAVISAVFLTVFSVLTVRAEDTDSKQADQTEQTNENADQISEEETAGEEIPDEETSEEETPEEETPDETPEEEPEIMHAAFAVNVNEALEADALGLIWSTDSESVAIAQKDDKIEIKGSAEGVFVLKGTDEEGTLRGEYEITVNMPPADGVWKYTGGWWYQYPNGSYAVNCWKEIGGIWYHFGGDGYMNTGWQQINNQWYLFDAGGAMQTGWVYQNAWYYLVPTGEMTTGWQYIDDVWYWFDSDGAMRTGWQWISGFWYLFDSGGAMQSGWIDQNGRTYYLLPTGQMMRGWQWIDDNWYYFDNSGGMWGGWLKYSGAWYYLLSSGVMVTGEQNINGVDYFFFDNGILKDAAYMLKSAPGGSAVSGFGGYTPGDSINALINQAVYPIQSNGYSIGFIMMDIHTGRGVAYNCDQTFYAASASKGPYIASLLDHDHNIADVSRDEILNVLTTSSDTAYESLFRRYLLSYIQDWVRELGIRSDVYGSGGYIDCSARELALLWSKCYDLFSSGSYGEGIASWYYHPNNSPIHEVLWNLYYTCSKAGWISESGLVSSTDAGIVYAYNGPYIIAIISNIPNQNSRLTDLVYALEAAHNEMLQE